ncbi:hypothetical protein RND71_020538 [Anisodus tanguticus]|uniref:Uncharacterized protein n=1 Tax=Anisodus tanguticus TaxID=243964 RepID=A0AAE1VFG7_9SOLA|nr:hypothetical protein RND71_020538 [Anisodus tanguticus]
MATTLVLVEKGNFSDTLLDKGEKAGDGEVIGEMEEPYSVAAMVATVVVEGGGELRVTLLGRVQKRVVKIFSSERCIIHDVAFFIGEGGRGVVPNDREEGLFGCCWWSWFVPVMTKRVEREKGVWLVVSCWCGDGAVVGDEMEALVVNWLYNGGVHRSSDMETSRSSPEMAEVRRRRSNNEVCKKCITRKITEEKSRVCPVCNLDLGVAPLQKIRPDHQVQEIRDIFSAKRREYIERGLIEDKSRKGEIKKLAHEDDDSNNSANMLIDNPLPPAAAATSSRRKEKSISSLVNTTPVDDQVSNQQNVSSTGRRRGGRNANNNAPRFQNSSKYNTVDLNTQIKGDQPGSSSIPILSGKATENKKQVESTPYAAESSKNDTISKKNKSTEPLDGMHDLWEPLNTLVTKGVALPNSNKSKSIEPVPNFTPLINLDDEDEDDEDDEEYVASPKTREHKVSKTNVVPKEERRSNVVPASAAAPSTSGNNNNDKGKGKKGRRGRKKKETNNIPAAGGGSNNNVAQVRVTQEAATSIGTILNERVNPIWFTLVASDKQECPSPLPQISSCYIKIKDVNMPVSYIKKYLAQKLSLQSEHEVDLRMLGMQLRPELPLYQLADLWLRAAEQQNSGIRKAKVGGSAKKFVMVLTYARNLKPQPN